jgi:uncharacterized spore protein YtfJ
MENLIALIELVSGRLEEAAQSDVVVGDPIVLGGVTLVPLSRLNVGFAGAGGTGEGDVPNGGGPGKRHGGKGGRGRGTGQGVGMGARVRPVGVAIFSDDGVEVVPIADKKGLLDKLFDKVPELIEKVQAVIEKKPQPAEG